MIVKCAKKTTLADRKVLFRSSALDIYYNVFSIIFLFKIIHAFKFSFSSSIANYECFGNWIRFNLFYGRPLAFLHLKFRSSILWWKLFVSVCAITSWNFTYLLRNTLYIFSCRYNYTAVHTRKALNNSIQFFKIRLWKSAFYTTLHLSVYF